MTFLTDPRRSVLPNRRNSEAVGFEHHGLAYRACVSRFEDGSIAEMFLDTGKTGTSANIIAKECAVMFSIARQYGAPEGVLFNALPKLHDGSPAGPMGTALALTRTTTHAKERG
jgi:hypothetical protein